MFEPQMELISEYHHYVLHKPYGYLSQFMNNQNRRKNKRLLGDLGDFHEGTMSIGRLDEKSEGLLLLTTDGRESERIRSDSIEKEYYVEVDGIITEEAITKLKSGISIPQKRSSYETKPCKARLLIERPIFENPPRQVRSENHGPTSWASITLTEGKFRQVRKMTAVVGFPTLRLVRVRIGGISLNHLKAGEYYKVDTFEV